MAIMARRFIKTVVLADIMSCIRIISFWHTVCFLISVRSGRSFAEEAEKQPDNKKSLNNNK